MSAWNIYENRIKSRGSSKREASLSNEQRFITSKLPHNLSYTDVLIDDIARRAAVIDTDNLDTKFIFSLPGEDIQHGGLVTWRENHWLIIEKDVANEVYTRAKMLQCNHLLKWIDTEGTIHEQWCVVEDGTKLRISFLAKRFACSINPLNCWKPLKPYMLQRNGERYISVKAAKARKNIWMVHG